MAATLKQLLEAGAHFGHQSRRWNPKMKSYIFTERDGVHVFDLVKTKEGLDSAYEYVKNLVANGGVILFVGSKRQAANMVRDTAKKVGMPYVTERWLGGSFTNFGQMKKRVDRMKDLKSKRESGELKQFTKREQLLFDREITKLERFFGGVANMDKLPTAVFVVDTHKEDTAVREAKKMGVVVVGLVDSNSDPEGVDYVIPANDDAVKSIQLVIEEIGKAVEAGQGKEAQVTKLQSDGVTVEKPKKTRKKKEVVQEVAPVKDEPEEV